MYAYFFVLGITTIEELHFPVAILKIIECHKTMYVMECVGHQINEKLILSNTVIKCSMLAHFNFN